MVGRTPWSARVPLNPLLAAFMKLADEGVGRGPGGPPHHHCPTRGARTHAGARFPTAQDRLPHYLKVPA